MGVYQRGDSWYIDFYYGGKRYTECVGAVTKTVAKEKLLLKKREVITGEYKPKIVKTPFEKFKEEYLKYSLANKKPRTAQRDGVSLKPLEDFFKGKFLSEIHPFLIEKYKQKRKEDGVTTRTINIEMACLRHMFNMAMKWGKAQKNPLKDVKFFKEPEAKDRILSPEEEIKLLDAIRSSRKGQHLEAIITTGILSGMRKSELLGLEWSNVDFGTRIITVEGTKSGYIRKIPMSSKLTEILQDVRKKSCSEYVFSDGEGKPFKEVRTSLKNALKKAGIEGVTLHTLRHTYGSRLGMLGTDVKTIQELMGHRDIKMTMRYSHPTADHKRKAVEMLDRVTTLFTTGQVDKTNQKVVNIGNH